MQTAAAYIRVSTEEQTEYSPDSQRKKIQEYADAHHIHLLEPYIFLDEGISGRNARKRPGFMKMIALAKQKPRPFDIILVWKFSRFARSRQDSILYKSMLRKECGIDVVSITEQLSHDPTSILIEALLEAMDEYYSINLAQEVRRGMNEKFSRGGVVSIPPFGYQMGSEHFEIDNEKAPFVTMIFHDFLQGSSCRQIAQKLNALGVRTSRGNLFESRSITYILSNPTYLGKLRRRAFSDKDLTIVEGKHLPLIEETMFQTAQSRLAASKYAHPSHTRESPVPFMLQGLVRCGQCGSTLTAVEKGKSLQCHKYTKGQCTKSHHIRLSYLNQAVLSKLKEDHYKEILTITLPKFALHSSANTRSIRIEQEYKRLRRIESAYESGIDTLEEYHTKKTAILSQIDALKKEPIPLTPSLTSISLSVTEIISLLSSSCLTETAKHSLLRSFVSYICFTRPQNTVQIYYHI